MSGGERDADAPTRGPRATVVADYDFETYDATIDRHVAFRPVEMDRDLGRLHAWLNGEHVQPYWRLAQPLPEFRDTLAEKLADDHHTLYVGHLDHVPMSYWEAYWAADDGLAEHYDADPADQGVHLLIGPEEYLGRGYALPLLRAIVRHQFGHPETDRVVAEPDVRNDVMIRVFEQCGFEPRREIAMEEKDALFMVCPRERFEREVWPDGRVEATTGVVADD